MKATLLQTPGKDGDGSARFHSLAKFQSVIFAGVMFCATGLFGADSYIAHEWGTFTSVQGGNGELLQWRPLQSSELPNFVYDWTKAGMNRGSMIGPKVGLITLQRLETPVIYFYGNHAMNVSVDVAFPKGYITEWYPQATQIGPTYPLNTNEPTNGILRESRAVWRNLEIVPQSEYQTGQEDQLPQDARGSHYFAARATGANLVRDTLKSPTNSAEVEKFIFYRGAGNFSTPLRVTVNSNNVLSVENTGKIDLAHLFLVLIETNNASDGPYGVMMEMDALPKGKTVEWQNLDAMKRDGWDRFPLEKFQGEISSQMKTALVAEGLFPEEAQAMVNTWKDSWFTEEGVRVLYVLPRAWTDETLPIAMTPQPNELTRVMVGRAEIVTPDAEMNLFESLTKAQNGDAEARAESVNEFKQFGRFAEPALRLALAHAAGTNAVNFAYRLLYPPQPSPFE
ncbi:MAG TPA: hypothetical protein VN761_00815 [Candidatus Polarisedimenticolia bacterium]|nr:hypothetical protein [Candidatus Polarisedimenticolia bacterium]